MECGTFARAVVEQEPIGITPASTVTGMEATQNDGDENPYTQLITAIQRDQSIFVEIS